MVCKGLLQKSVNAFLPKLEVWSRRKDRKKRIQVPMFAGYLFVELDISPDNQARLNVLTTPGVVRILGKPVGGQPIPIPAAQIDAIQRLVESKVEMQRITYPKIGENARIVDGPFKGIEGKVLGTDLKKELFVVSIDLLQRSVAIQIEGFKLEKI
jgi:transcription antitermination factor NusG